MDISYVSRGEFWIPTRGSEGAAGWDLYAAEDRELKPFVPTLVPTNIDVAVPQGCMMLILPRSGNSLKRQLIIPNSPGLIDEDYRGHLQVLLTWIPSPEQVTAFLLPTEIKKGERIAQAVLMPYVVQNWTRRLALPPSLRGVGGFGSTGQ